MTNENAVSLNVTITRKGATRYSYFSRSAFRTLPMPRAKAEAMIADGTGAVYEIRDYMNGDGEPVRVAAVVASEIH